MSTIRAEARNTIGKASISPLKGFLYESTLTKELAKWLFNARRVLREPKGDGHAVMVLPGYGQDDSSTGLMRSYLKKLGYCAFGWDQGCNDGDAGQHTEALLQHVDKLNDQTAAPVSLIGWSMGGCLARELASLYPHKIRQVITLGSPVTGGLKYTAFASYLRGTGSNLEAIEQRWIQRQQPLEVPITAIYSRRDGVVAWQACIDQVNAHVEHVEVNTSHFGLGYNPEVYSVIARRLHDLKINA